MFYILLFQINDISLTYNTFINQVNMSDVNEYVKVLHNWREQDGKTIMQVLQRVTQAKAFKESELDNVCRSLFEFHREIGKAEDSQVDPKWFQYTINLKKKLKKLQEAQEKQKKEKPHLEKKPSIAIQYPQVLTAGRGPIEQQYLKHIYKSFITYFQDAIKASQTVPFVQAVLREIKYIFEDKSEDQMVKRINSICIRLARQSSQQSKSKMLKGQISSKDLAIDDEQLYFDQKTKDTILQNQKDALEACQTGFYDEMKKKINKDACEECRYCRKKQAFCEDMKQIRASDEPMTRFMRCNACGKAWRD